MNTQGHILFRGHTVTPDWPEKIRAAQKHPSVEVAGKEWKRVRFGEEAEDWGASRGPCSDCCAIKGELHVFGCDRERCPACGGQLAFGCECSDG